MSAPDWRYVLGQPGAANVSAPDWRYVLGQPEAMNRMTRHLASELVKRPPTGKAIAHALLKFMVYLRGRFTMVDDDLSAEWNMAISQFCDMVHSSLQDASDSAAKYDTERHARRQESPMTPG